MTGVSIVIPVHNEAAGVGESLNEVRETMAGLASDLPWEIIVVDDGSTDGSGAAIEPWLGDRVRMVRHRRCRGYGAALKTGIRESQQPWILITDADGTYPAAHIPELLRNREKRGMVVGARLGGQAHIPWIRRPAKWALRRLASVLSGTEIVDLNSGLRLFPKKLAERYLRLLPDGFSFTSTLTLVTLSLGELIRYVPIDYRGRKGRSKIRPIRDTLGFLHLIIRTMMFFDPMRVLLPTSMCFLLASVAVGVGSFLLTGKLMDVTTVLLFVTGVQLLVLGMIAEAIHRRIPP